MLIPNRLAIAVIAVAVTFSSTMSWAREQRPRHKQEHNANVPAQSSARSFGYDPTKEPFTAAQKRAFQEPTGRKVDRW
jgi:hypothetical protein